MSFKYQWRRCDAAGSTCRRILGATAAAYTLRAADVGHRLRTFVTAQNLGGSAARTSGATKIVAS
jgi:hypothetical protein